MKKMPLIKAIFEYKKLVKDYGIVDFKNQYKNEYHVFLDPFNHIKDQSNTFWHESAHLFMRLLERIALKYGEQFKNEFSTGIGYLMNGDMKKEEWIACRIAAAVEKELAIIKVILREDKNGNGKKRS